LFDRDGTLIVDKKHQFRPAEIEWIPGSREALRLVAQAGYGIGVITNQSAVARGICTERQVRAFHAAMACALREAGVRVDLWSYCPFHGEAILPRYQVADHPDRKPNPGMIVRAMERLRGDPARSFMIGDHETDVEAGERAGIRGVRFTGSEPLDLSVARILIERPLSNLGTGTSRIAHRIA
jgi:D-glycero-D-manno-heptose 1,7-bisphosphate phosphatase